MDVQNHSAHSLLGCCVCGERPVQRSPTADELPLGKSHIEEVFTFTGTVLS